MALLAVASASIVQFRMHRGLHNQNVRFEEEKTACGDNEAINSHERTAQTMFSMYKWLE